MIGKILTYGEIDRAEWEVLVLRSKTGTWFQTPEAYNFYTSMPELFMPFVIGIANDPAGAQTHLRAICVGYVTVEQNPIKQYFTRRAIIIGGPALADDCTEEEVSELLEAIRNGAQKRNDATSLLNDELMSPIYIETRNFNDYSKWKRAFETAGFAYKQHLNFHVDCTNEKKLWDNLSDNRKRQITKSDSAVNEAIREQEIKEWYKILAELYRTKVKTPLFPVEFFLEAYKQKIAKFMIAKHNGKVIGGSMIVEDEKNVYEWYECGMNAEYKDQYPSVLVTYAGMKYAHAQGRQRYDMMGAGVPGIPYGVRDFKAEFGGEMVEQGRFLCVCKPWLYRFGSFVVKILKGK